MTIDLTHVDTKAALHMLMKRELHFPDWYGVSWDAFSNRPNPTPPGTFAAARAYLPILKPLPAMHLRARIIDDVNSIADLQMLHQLFDYVQVIKRTSAQAVSNREAVLRLAGTLNDAEAQAQRQTLTQEFGRIEGEW